MKKIIGLMCFVAIMLSMSLVTFGGDVPEGLLSNDSSQVFFGEVVSYQPDGEIPYVEVIPTKKIKGDVIVDGSCAIWQYAERVGDFEVVIGNEYLFTWFDGNNPTNIFEVTSYDTKTLKLKNVTGDMWERFEDYLNKGEYEKAEQERLKKPNPVNLQQKPQNLAQLFRIDRNNVEKIEVIYPLEDHPAGCYVDVEKFFDLAESILLNETDEPSPLDTDGVFIVARDKDGNRYGVWLDKHARVDNEAAMSSSIITTAYSVSDEDYIKLYSFLPEEATAHIPFKNPMKNYIGVIVGIMALVFALAFVIGLEVKKKKINHE